MLEGHTFPVRAVAFLSTGSIVSAGSYDNTVRVWSPDGSCKSVLQQPNPVYCLTVLPDDTFIVGGLRFVRKWAGDVEQWTAPADGFVVSVTPEAFKLSFGRTVFFDPIDGRKTGAYDGDVKTLTSAGCGKVLLRRRHQYQVTLLKVYRPSRIAAIRVLQAAWLAYKGKPCEESVRTLALCLCLRRFCRVRGPHATVNMPNEVVEPFARDIVRFL